MSREKLRNRLLKSRQDVSVLHGYSSAKSRWSPVILDKSCSMVHDAKNDFICLNLTTSSSPSNPEFRRSACQASNFLFALSVFVWEYLNNLVGWPLKTSTNIIGRDGANFNLQGFDTEKCFSAPADSVTVLSYGKMSFFGGGSQVHPWPLWTFPAFRQNQATCSSLPAVRYH